MQRDRRQFTIGSSFRHAFALTGTIAALAAPTLIGSGCASGPDLAEGEIGRTSAAQIVSTSPDQSLTVEVFISRMIADHITNEPGFGNTRDETYLLVQRTLPTGPYDSRLPLHDGDDDYYQFWSSKERNDTTEWTDQDQADLGYPRIWNGTLALGQAASFQVAVMEQENLTAQRLKAPLKAACAAIKLGVIVAGGDKTADAVAAGCTALADTLPDSTADDIIGVFQLDLKNVDGTLAVNTVPLKIPGADVTRQNTGDAQETYQKAQDALGRVIDTFRMTGAGSSYLTEVAVKATPTITNPLRYFGNTNDACRQDGLYVLGINGPVYLPQGAPSTDVRVAGADFNWTCGGSWEHTHCNNGTDYVRAVHDRSGGGIHWACFQEEMRFTHKLGDGLYQPSGSSLVWRLYGDNDCYLQSAAEQAEFGVSSPRIVDDLGDGHAYQGPCPYPHCSNGIKDDVESGLDCGNQMCLPCGVGGGCNWDSDCTTNLCNRVAKVCVTSHCADSRQDADEEGIDCGGASCKACVVKKCPSGTHDCDGKCLRICP